MEVQTPGPKSKQRPIFTLKFRPEPGIDGIRALRALLKAALRRFGLKCISADERIRADD